MIFPETRLQKDEDGCLIAQRASETAKKNVLHFLRLLGFKNE